PLPPDIPGEEFDRLGQCVADPADLALLTRWYRRDGNGVPPVYCLQPRYGADTNYERWSAVERRLSTVLRGAARQLDLPPERRLAYVAGATEMEIARGVLDAGSPPGAAFCFVRTIDGLPADATAGGFRDLDENGRPDGEAEALLADLTSRV